MKLTDLLYLMDDKYGCNSDVIVHYSVTNKEDVRTVECWIALIKLGEVWNDPIKKIEPIAEFYEPLTKDSIYPIIKITV